MTAGAVGRVGPAIGDSAAMAGRNLRRLLRSPDQVVFTLISPIMFTLLFRYVFAAPSAGSAASTMSTT